MLISQFRQKILDFARHDGNIRLVVETGAFARDSPPADALSDLDIEFYARDPQILLESRAWIDQFGPVLICLELENDGFNPTRLVIYECGAKVDFSVYDAPLLDTGFHSQPQNRGYLVHLDKDGATQSWGLLTPPTIAKLDEKQWRGLIDDFWLDTHNLAKYIERDDLWTVKFLDAEIKSYVLQMLEWHGAARGADVWHMGHHMENWTDAATFAEIEAIFAHFNAADSRRAMWATCDLFGRLAREVGVTWKFGYPVEVEKGICSLIQKMES